MASPHATPDPPQPPAQPPAFLTVKQAAAALCVTTGAIYKLCETGKLACHRFGAGSKIIRISPADLTAYIESTRRTGPTPDAEELKRQAGVRIKAKRDALVGRMGVKYLANYLPKSLRN